MSSSSSSGIDASGDISGLDAVTGALFTLHDGLARQGPGSDATTRRLLAAAGPLPARPRILDAGCGTGPATLLLAAEAGAIVTAVDLHQPYLDELVAEAARRGVSGQVSVVQHSMDRLPFPDHSFDVIWAESSVYTIGFDTALRVWRRLLAPGGVLAITEIEWTGPNPDAEVRAYWDAAYQLRTYAENTEAALSAGYRVHAHWPLPEADWWREYYTPLTRRMQLMDPNRPGMREALAALRTELDIRNRHHRDYRYAAYILRPDNHTTAPTENGTTMNAWTTRPETSSDIPAVRAVELAAFPTAEEADLVDALRTDPEAWIDGLSMITTTATGEVVGHALLTRCFVGGAPALALAPCAVRPEYQRTGAGSAAIRSVLDSAAAMGENLVVVLGHAEYYPRFGFTPASRFGIRAPFDAPDEAMMALALDSTRPIPHGTIAYPAAFGV